MMSMNKYYYPNFIDEEIRDSERLSTLLRPKDKWKVSPKYEDDHFFSQNINPICNFWINSNDLFIWKQ